MNIVSEQGHSVTLAAENEIVSEAKENRGCIPLDCELDPHLLRKVQREESGWQLAEDSGVPNSRRWERGVRVPDRWGRWLVARHDQKSSKRNS